MYTLTRSLTALAMASAALLVSAPAAAAHTPSATVSCAEGTTITLTQYDPETVVTINGATYFVGIEDFYLSLTDTFSYSMTVDNRGDGLDHEDEFDVTLTGAADGYCMVPDVQPVTTVVETPVVTTQPPDVVTVLPTGSELPNIPGAPPPTVEDVPAPVVNSSAGVVREFAPTELPRSGNNTARLAILGLILMSGGVLLVATRY